MSFLVQCFVALSNDIFILFIRRKINNLIGNNVFVMIHLAIRRFNKAVFIDSRIGAQRTNQTNIGTFRGLNRTHAAVVGIVHITYLKSSPIPAQATRSQGTQPSLMSQLSQRIGLIHELGQLAAPEKLLDGGGNRTDIDQCLRSDHIHILNRHPFLYNPLHSGQSNAELVLKQLSDRAKPPVPEMIDIIHMSDPIRQMQIIADGSNNIINQNMLWHQFVVRALQFFL